MNLYFYCHRSSLLNLFFLYSTKLAELWVTIAILLALFYFRNSYAIFYLLLIVAVTLIVFFLKHHVFGYVRPALYMQGRLELKGVGGMPLLQNYSFPSGHTTFIFASMYYLSELIKNKWAHILLFALAVACALSRVYLFQHFYIDIYVGAILGILISKLLILLTQSSILSSSQKFLSYSIKHDFFKR